MGVRGIRMSSRVLSDSFVDGADHPSWESNMIQTGTSSSSETSFSSDSPPKANYIEHRVSKMDTLPGVAIKYGVEVEDIKRLNGLMTDIQMFAHKILLIPLPGKHPPSNSLSHNSVADSHSRDHTPPCRFGADVLDLLNSMKTKTYPRQISSAMSSLQSYYGFTELKKSSSLEGSEMTVYRTGGSCSDDEICWSTNPPFSDSYARQDWKTTSLIHGFLSLNGKSKENDDTISNNAESIDMENSIRRRQKGDANESLSTPELQFKEENGSGFSGWKGKGLAARPKLASKTEIDMALLDVTLNGDSFIYAGSSPVRKSFSTPALQENENSSFIWPTSTWTLTEDLVRPLLVGLPIPRSVWKNKAAVD